MGWIRSGLIVAMLFGMAAVGSGWQMELQETCEWHFAAEGVDREEFYRFDRDLRAALASGDVRALAMLVAYPLRVNDSGAGTILITDPYSLQARFDEVFPASVRQAVLATEPAQASCFSYLGQASYGHGDVWVSRVGEGGAERFAVIAVNVVSESAPPEPHLEFVCNGAEYRAAVEYAEGTWHLHAWGASRPLNELPELHIVNGTKRYEGTGPFTHAIWEFVDGDVQIELTNLAHLPGQVGSIAIDGLGEEASWSACY